MSTPAWIAVDWGTTNLRATIMDDQDRVLNEYVSDSGAGHLKPQDFAPTLEALTGEASLPVVACGMLGSRQGWQEAPYLTVPCKPPSIAQGVSVGRVRILPGVKQDTPADVMRGEETQIKGVLSVRPDYDGVICLPGTHTKWVHVSAGEIVSFRTAMTGELFALVLQQSILRHSVDTVWNEEAFETALSDAMSRPETLVSGLFNIRAKDLLGQARKGEARARVSGLLMGAELAAMRPYWLGQPVIVVAAVQLAASYVRALSLQGVQAEMLDDIDMTRRGLSAARAELEAL